MLHTNNGMEIEGVEGGGSDNTFGAQTSWRVRMPGCVRLWRI